MAGARWWRALLIRQSLQLNLKMKRNLGRVQSGREVWAGLCLDPWVSGGRGFGGH